MNALNVFELQRKFPCARVLVVGDLMLDEYLSGSVTRISPEAPVPVIDLKSRRHVAGGAANVAMNIRTLRGLATIVGLVGCDPSAKILRSLLENANIPTAGLVESAGRGTISKTRIVAGQQQIVRIDSEDRSIPPPELQAAIVATVSKLLPEHDICILSDYAKGTLTDFVCASIIKLANESAKQVIVDPKGQGFGKYLGCSLITPNLLEAGAAVGIAIEVEADLLEAGRRLRAVLPSSSVLITRGAEGMTLFEGAEDPVTVRALARRVFDVVGAGDTVVATLALALATSLPLPLAMRLANVAASVVVGKPGTATTTIEELFEN